MDGFLRLISRSPTIVLRDDSLAQIVDESLSEQPVCHWVLIPRACSAEEVLALEAGRKQRRPKDQAIYFCTDYAVFRQLRDNPSVQVTWAALESFVDERIFNAAPPATAPEFDAVMVSRDIRLKRQELAVKVAKLLMIMPHNQTPLSDRGYIDELRDRMSENATFLLTENKPIPRRQLAKELKRARVGLTLSAAEGVNRVCYEYQLAGLPVVSTCNSGGRNQFLDPDTSMIVPADPDAVAAAVRELCSRKLSPKFVREKVLDRLRAHRQEIIRIGQAYWTEHGRHQDFARHIYQLTQRKPLVVREPLLGKLAGIHTLPSYAG